MFTLLNDVLIGVGWWHTIAEASVQWGVGTVAAVGCYTLRGRCVCVFGVKSGDLCGSEGVVAQGAYWHNGK